MDDKAEEIFCRICYSEINPITNKNDLISPCDCNGSVKHVHYTCLKMWMMKGKAFGEMKRCEQCKSIYKMPGEKPIYTFFISFTSLLCLFTFYCISAAIFKNFCIAVTSVIEELASVMIYDHFSIHAGIYRDYHLACCMVFISFYHIFTSPKALLIAVYLISYTGIMIYESTFAKLMFGIISVYLLKKMYSDTYELIDGFYYYVLNINWEKKHILLRV